MYNMYNLSLKIKHFNEFSKNIQLSKALNNEL